MKSHHITAKFQKYKTSKPQKKFLFCIFIQKFFKIKILHYVFIQMYIQIVSRYTYLQNIPSLSS